MMSNICNRRRRHLVVIGRKRRDMPDRNIEGGDGEHNWCKDDGSCRGDERCGGIFVLRYRTGRRQWWLLDLNLNLDLRLVVSSFFGINHGILGQDFLF